MDDAQRRLIGPAQVWPLVDQVTRSAIEAGALETIATSSTNVMDGGVEFVVREVSSLVRKFKAQAERNQNPFLPYEERLYLGDLTPAHVALLNKYPVMAHHLLVISRAFVHQETLLLPEDFIALASAMKGRECLAFYNAGREAGASQPHRHMQLVPLPSEGMGAETPVSPVLAKVRGKVGADIADLGYRHVLGWLSHDTEKSHQTRGLEMHALYRQLIGLADIQSVPSADGDRQSCAYNLLATKSWMLVVPRSAERFHTISVNALGFAGSLFVRNDAERDLVRSVGPRAVLAAVTG